MLTNQKHRNLALIGGIIASAVSAIMGISVWASVNAGFQGLITGILIFSVIEILAILSAISLFNPQMAGVIRGFATLVLIACISTEIFVTANEMQGGVLKKIETAKTYNTGTTSKAEQIAELQKQLAACPPNHYKKCRTPILEAIKTAQAQTDTVQYSANNAAELAKWQTYADSYNQGKMDEDKVTVDQVAFFVFMALGIIIAVGKVFLYALHGNSGDESTADDYPTLPPTGTDDDTDSRKTSRPQIGFGARFAPTAKTSDQAPRNHGSNVSYIRPAANDNRPTRLPTAWSDGNAAFDQNSITNDCADTEIQLKTGTVDKNSAIFNQYQTAIVNRTVRPTLRPSVDFLRAAGVEGSNEYIRTVAEAYIAKLESDGVIVDSGRPAKHPMGKYDVAN